jgi:hypothetical protein
VIEGFLRSNFSALNKPSIKLSPRWATDAGVDWVKPVAFRNKTLLTFNRFPKTFNDPKPNERPVVRLASVPSRFLGVSRHLNLDVLIICSILT